MAATPPPSMPQNTPQIDSTNQPQPAYAQGAPPPAPAPGGAPPPQGWVPQQQPQQQVYMQQPGYMPQQRYIPPGGYPGPQIIPIVPGRVYPQAVFGMKVIPPRPTPMPGQVLIGWEIAKPEPGCCQCEGLSNSGWMIVIILAIIFPILCWIPCVMEECYDTCQRPVYAYPQGGPPPPQAQMGTPMPSPQAAAVTNAAASKV